jgi:hypothetical protein
MEAEFGFKEYDRTRNLRSRQRRLRPLEQGPELIRPAPLLSVDRDPERLWPLSSISYVKAHRIASLNNLQAPDPARIETKFCVNPEDDHPLSLDLIEPLDKTLHVLFPFLVSECFPYHTLRSPVSMLYFSTSLFEGIKGIFSGRHNAKEIDCTITKINKPITDSHSANDLITGVVWSVGFSLDAQCPTDYRVIFETIRAIFDLIGDTPTGLSGYELNNLSLYPWIQGRPFYGIHCYLLCFA